MVYRLRDFGSYAVGGRVHEVTEGEPRIVNFTRSASYEYDPRGHFVVEQTYVQYFIPENRLDAPPMVLVHGGGMHGSTWETTPDGRPGWLHLLLERGYEVHVVDLVERGRSGFAAGIWTDTPIMRSAEEAWSLFRIGAPEDFAARKPFKNQQFPVAAIDQFLKQFVPRWLTTSPLQIAGLVAVLDHIGEAVLICHSQGGEIAFDATLQRSDAVRGILAVEPSDMPSPEIICPVAIIAGDYLDVAPHWVAREEGWRAAIAELTRRGRSAHYLDTAKEIALGASHFPMMDRRSADHLESGLQLLQKTV